MGYVVVLGGKETITVYTKLKTVDFVNPAIPVLHR